MKILVSVTMLLTASILLSSCGAPAGNNAATANNRPGNTANATGNSASTSANADADIKKIMAELASELEKNDADAVAKHYADDYQLITPSGEVQTKAQRIGDMKSGASKFEAFSYNDITVRTYGDTAVATTTVKVKGTLAGRQSTPESRATLVFRKMGDTWKVVHGQATPLTGAATAPASNTAPANNAAPSNK